MKQSIVIGKSEHGAVELNVPRLIVSRMLATADSGGGKSWLLRKILEEVSAHTQTIVIDPEGEFASLREIRDMVLVSPDGEVQADVRSAPLLCRKLMELNLSAVIDINEMTPRKREEFVAAFCSAMVNLPRSLWHPCFIAIDEIHDFAPEKEKSISEDAVASLSSKGRKRGFCLIGATQRLAKLSKNVAAGLKNQLLGTFSLDGDIQRAASFLGFNKDRWPEIRDLSGPGHEGEFFAVGPAFNHRGVVKMRSGKVKTTHPEAGMGAAAPPAPSKKIKSVLPELADLPQQADAEIHNLEQAKAHIRELERAAKSALIAKSVAVSSKQDKAIITQLRKGLAEAMKLIKEIESREAPSGVDVAKVQAILTSAGEQIVREMQRTTGQQEAEWGRMKSKAADMANRLAKLLDGEIVTAGTAAAAATIQLPRARREVVGVGAADESLGKCERAILVVLAQHSEGCEIDKLSLLAGYRTSGGFRNSLTDLRNKGFITGGNAETMRITDAGVDAVGAFEPLPRGKELQQYWLSHPSLGKCERAVLNVLIESHPHGMRIDELAKAAGYETSGGFRNSLTDLRKAGVMVGGNTEEMKAADSLFA